MGRETLEDCWTKEEERKFYRLKEKDETDKLISYIVYLMIKYDLLRLKSLIQLKLLEEAGKNNRGG